MHTLFLSHLLLLPTAGYFRTLNDRPNRWPLRHQLLRIPMDPPTPHRSSVPTDQSSFLSDQHPPLRRLRNIRSLLEQGLFLRHRSSSCRRIHRTSRRHLRLPPPRRRRRSRRTRRCLSCVSLTQAAAEEAAYTYQPRQAPPPPRRHRREATDPMCQEAVRTAPPATNLFQSHQQAQLERWCRRRRLQRRCGRGPVWRHPGRACLLRDGNACVCGVPSSRDSPRQING